MRIHIIFAIFSAVFLTMELSALDIGVINNTDTPIIFGASTSKPNTETSGIRKLINTRHKRLHKTETIGNIENTDNSEQSVYTPTKPIKTLDLADYRFFKADPLDEDLTLEEAESDISDTFKADYVIIDNNSNGAITGFAGTVKYLYVFMDGSIYAYAVKIKASLNKVWFTINKNNQGEIILNWYGKNIPHR